MTTFHIGINGFDRLSRIFLRTCIEYAQLQVTAINDPNLDLKYICYLIKYDSTHGNFKGTVKKIDNGLLINGKRVEVFHNKKPECIPWFLADVDYVVETTGQYTSLKLASLHLTSNLKVKRGVKRVLVTAPSKDIPVIILGVNHNELTSEMKIVSCASSTLYCLAPIIKVLDDHFGVVEGSMSSVHALTPSLKSLDGNSTKSKHWRDHRGALQNIIPAPSGACRTLGRVLPHLDNKLCGLAYRIPVSDVSLLDLTVRLEKSTSLSEIIQRVEEASQSHMQGIIITSEEETVSSDYKGNKHSCIFDGNSSLALNENFYKLVCWYENEYSYACRIAELIIYAENPSLRPPTQVKSTSHKDKITRDLTETYKSQVDEYNYNSNNQDKNITEYVIPIVSQKHYIDRNLSTFKICDCFMLQGSETYPSNLNQTITMVKQSTDINTSLRTQNSGCYTAEVQELFEGHSCNHNKTNIDKDYNIETDHNKFIMKPKYHESEKMENGHSDTNILKTYGLSLNKKPPILKDISASANKFFNINPITLEENEPGHSVAFQIENLTKAQVKPKETSESRIEIRKQQNKIFIDDINTLSDFANAAAGEEEEFFYFVGEPKRGRQNHNQQVMISIPTRLEIEDEKDSNTLLQNNGMRKETPPYNINHNLRNYVPLETLSEFKPYKSTSTSSKETDGSPTNRNRGGSSIALSDKLESASDTDSVFSFKMLDTNSAEIKFCDITDSLEDLERLDKICRIIEISNELSDNLFVKLENEQNQNPTTITTSEWSLKMFCEKVKLDNFFKPHRRSTYNKISSTK